MSIQPDHWIKKLSSGRVYRAYTKRVVFNNLPPLTKEDELSLSKLSVGEEYYCAANGCIYSLEVSGDMITPFIDRSEKCIDFHGKILSVPSYGLSSYGYDLRIGNTFKIKKSPDLIDPAKLGEIEYDIIETDSLVMPPKSFALGVTMEAVNMPPDVLAICMGKSTCARYGLSAQITPIEPGFSGHITIELFNMNDVPLIVYAGQGIMQMLFYKGDPCETTYADRNGKYQGQPNMPIEAR